MACDHGSTESLGFDHGVHFLLCLACHSVIVTDGETSLAVPALPAAG